ncbi:MAG TPA: CAP domain-containing protein [Solirubrobacteraceae bacterium]|nr:CAP domain-containing protein [Solirubrobacteraceae bacterium]
MLAKTVMAGVTIVALTASSSRGASPDYDSYLAPDSVCPADDLPMATAERMSVMMCLIDYARATRGLARLPRVPQLSSSARLKAGLIVRCDEFDHRACGRPMQESFEQAGYMTGYATWEVGESLAYGVGMLGRPRAVLRAWLRSDRHRANLLDSDWEAQGIAVRQPGALFGLRDNSLWVSHFGRRDVSP